MFKYHTFKKVVVLLILSTLLVYWVVSQTNTQKVTKKVGLYKQQVDEISIMQLSSEINSLNSSFNACFKHNVSEYGYCQPVTKLNSQLDVSFLKKNAKLTLGQTYLQGVIRRSGNDVFGNPYLVSPGKNGVHVSPKTFAKLVHFIQQESIQLKKGLTSETVELRRSTNKKNKVKELQEKIESIKNELTKVLQQLKEPEIQDGGRKTALLKYQQAELGNLYFRHQMTFAKLTIEPNPRITQVRDKFITAIQNNDLNFIIPELGATPLIYAVRDDKMLILLKLLQSSIDLNETDNRLLVTAARSPNTLILKLLLEFGADPNLPDRYGEYPLHSSLTYRQPAQMQVLLSYQADPNIRDQNGDTPYRWAYDLKDTIYKQLLEAAGADTVLPNQ